MNGITEPLDVITDKLEDFAKFGVRGEDISVAVGSIAIGELVSYFEKKFVRGWLRPALLMIGGFASYYAAGSARSDRLKREGIIIGSDLLVNAIKDIITNKEEVIETAKKTIESIKSGNIAAAVSSVSGGTVEVAEEPVSYSNYPVTPNTPVEQHPAQPAEEQKVVKVFT